MAKCPHCEEVFLLEHIQLIVVPELELIPANATEEEGLVEIHSEFNADWEERSDLGSDAKAKFTPVSSVSKRKEKRDKQNRSAKRPRRKMSFLEEVFRFTVAALLAIPVAYVLVLWTGADPLKLGPEIKQVIPILVPEYIQDASLD